MPIDRDATHDDNCWRRHLACAVHNLENADILIGVLRADIAHLTTERNLAHKFSATWKADTKKWRNKCLTQERYAKCERENSLAERNSLTDRLTDLQTQFEQLYTSAQLRTMIGSETR